MSTYYVSPSGSDSNNGLGPDASHASNKPWLTIGKALGAAGIASGDTVYIGPGTYRATVAVAMTSATVETSVLGDPGNAQGFKNGSGVLLDPGEVVCSAYTTSDVAAPSGAVLLDIAGRDFLTFRFITFVGGTGYTIGLDTQTSTNIVFRDCVLASASSVFYMVNVDGAFGVALVHLWERCVFLNLRASNGVFRVNNDTGSGADYDMDITIRNCLAIGGGYFVESTPSGAGAQKPGGIDIYNCTFIDVLSVALTANANFSTTYPINVLNCFASIVQAGVGFNATTSGQIVENYNYVAANTTHTNVSVGANTITTSANRAPRFHVGESEVYGFTRRLFMTPVAGSWPLTFGNDTTYTSAEDFLGLPRPGGGQSATKGIGYLGRGNTFAKETTTVRTGANALSITGPGVQDFQVPVDAVSTTVTLYVRWDSTYAGTKPQMKVLNGGECGVTNASVTAAGAANAWEQLSLTFTPTRAGIVTVRLQSSDTNGGGKMFADDFAVG